MNIEETYEFMRELTRLRKAEKIVEYDELKRKHPEHLSPERVEELIEYAEEKVNQQYYPLRRAIDAEYEISKKRADRAIAHLKESRIRGVG